MPGDGTNLLLNALSRGSREHLLARSKTVSLPLRTVLHRPDEVPQYAYFLTSGVASVLNVMESGESVEIAMIGREGVTGCFYMLGPATAHTQCFVQSEGSALRIPLGELCGVFRASEEVRGRILEYMQAQMFMLAQIAACHRLHTAEQRLARWMLMVRDRLQADRFDLTHEFLGEVLGSRRTTVTLVAGGLRRSGLIEYWRGRIRILDGDGLESAACPCYPVLRKMNSGLYSARATTGK